LASAINLKTIDFQTKMMQQPEPMAEKGLTLINQENLMRNMASVERCRTAVNVISGIVAGSLGLTSLPGFLCFLIFLGFLNLLLVLNTGISEKQWKNYFINRWQTFLFQSFFSGLFVYIVFWTFFYGIVNVY